MGMNLTVEVSDVSSEVSLSELIIFFSYCGTVEKIQLHRSAKDESSQWAFVTFRQPYASQTALLLDNDVLSGRTIRVCPTHDVPIVSAEEEVEVEEIVPGIRCVIQDVSKRLSVIFAKASKFAVTAHRR